MSFPCLSLSWLVACDVLFYCDITTNAFPTTAWILRCISLPSGAESPQAIQKLMGLSTSVKPHKSHYPHTPAPSGVTSPSLSSGRRPPTSPRHSAALRSHPVHLSPESSSVISLSNIANYRRPQRTGKIAPCPPNSVRRETLGCGYCLV